MIDESLSWTPAWRLRELVQSKEVSPVEITQYFLDRIDRLDPKINSFITVAGEDALKQAQAVEDDIAHGKTDGALLGVPFGVKDQIWTKGIRTTAGSLIYKDFIPPTDSIHIQRLRNAGAIILGKTNCPEFGMYIRTMNRIAEECVNPWDTRMTSGGSSGGSAAAVSAGLIPAALATDGSGSGRVPSAFCGVFALHGSDGRVPRGGSFGGSLFMSGTGPITRDVRDAAVIFQVLAGHDPADSTSMPDEVPDYLSAIEDGVDGLRVAWTPNYGFHKSADGNVVEAAHVAARKLKDLGADVDEPEFNIIDPTDAQEIIKTADRYASFGMALYEDPAKRALLSSYARTNRFEKARVMTASEYSLALKVRYDVIAQFRDIFEKYDVIVTPTAGLTSPQVSPEVSDVFTTSWGDMAFAFLGLTSMINFTGLTAASVPCGFVDGLPVGLQVIGERNNEAMVLRVSRAIERAYPWADRKPPID